MASMKREMTPKQQERQHAQHRQGGQYGRMNPCELCGKGVGADYFTSDHHGKPGFGGAGLILHKACAAKLDAMPQDAALAALGKAKPAPKVPAKPVPTMLPPTPRMKQIDAEIAQVRAELNKPENAYGGFTLKSKLLDLRQERARLFKEQHAHVEASVLKKWARAGLT